MTHCVRWWVVPDPTEIEIWGFKRKPKRTIGNCRQTVSSMLPHGEYKRAISPPAKLFLVCVTFALKHRHDCAVGYFDRVTFLSNVNGRLHLCETLLQY